MFLLLSVCMYVLARLKLRWMDLIRWQRRSVVLSCFFPFLWELALWHLCCAHPRNGPQERTFRQKCCFKGKKKMAHTKEDIPTGLTSGQMQRFGSHTSLSVVSSAIFLCTIFKKKCTQINKKKKVYKCKTKKKIFLGRGSICIL